MLTERLALFFPTLEILDETYSKQFLYLKGQTMVRSVNDHAVDVRRLLNLRTNDENINCAALSGVQRSSDARGDCLIGCPPTKF